MGPIAYFFSGALSAVTTIVLAAVGTEDNKPPKERFGRPWFSTNSYEGIIASDIIVPEKNDTEFSLIGGLNNVKDALRELVISPLTGTDLPVSKFSGAQRGVLLYGPLGTGKTMLAKAVAKESGAILLNIRMSTLTSRFFGESTKLVSAVFTLARKLQPAIIFIDEVDSFLGKHCAGDSEGLALMKAEFISMWDSIMSDKKARVVVLAASNRPGEIDPAILRRFAETFLIGFPNQYDRADILKLILKDEKIDGQIDYLQVAKLCDGYTFLDLFELCKRAAHSAWSSSSLLKRRSLRKCDLLNAISHKDVKAKGMSKCRYSKAI